MQIHIDTLNLHINRVNGREPTADDIEQLAHLLGINWI